MTSDDVGPHNQIDQEQAWKILIELTLSREPGKACSAVDQVVEAMRSLNWPAAHLERLKLALVKAMWNVMERSRLFGPEAQFIIRVLIPEDDKITQETDQVNDEARQHQVSELTTHQTDWPSSRGWGFFLVQKQEDDPQPLAEEPQYMIEVFLYKESDRSQRYRQL